MFTHACQDDSQQKATLQLPSLNRPPSSQSVRRSGSERPSSRALLTVGTHLDPIPGSPYATEQSTPPSPASTTTPSIRSGVESNNSSPPRKKDSPNGKASHSDSSVRGKQKSVAYAQQPQSLDAALEQLEQLSASQSEKDKRPPASPTNLTNGVHYLSDSTHDELYPPSDNSPPVSLRGKSRGFPASPSRPIPVTPVATVGGKIISSPIINHGALQWPTSFCCRDSIQPAC